MEIKGKSEFLLSGMILFCLYTVLLGQEVSFLLP